MIDLFNQSDSFYVGGIIVILILIVLVVLVSNIYRNIRGVFRKGEVADVGRLSVDSLASVDEEVVNKEEAKNELEEMLLKMKQNLEGKIEEDIVTFERDQEENAIISYAELLEANGREVPEKPKQKDLVDVIESIYVEPKINSEILEPILTSPIYFPDDLIIEDIPKAPIIDDIEFFDEPAQSKSYSKKFKTTDVISPIYGIIDDVSKYQELYDKNDTNSLKSVVDFEQLSVDDIVDEKDFDSTKVSENDNLDFLERLREFKEQL